MCLLACSGRRSGEAARRHLRAAAWCLPSPHAREAAPQCPLQQQQASLRVSAAGHCRHHAGEPARRAGQPVAAGHGAGGAARAARRQHAGGGGQSNAEDENLQVGSVHRLRERGALGCLPGLCASVAPSTVTAFPQTPPPPNTSRALPNSTSFPPPAPRTSPHHPLITTPLTPLHIPPLRCRQNPGDR